MTNTHQSVGGRPIWDLQFADIGLVGGSDGELQDFINKLQDRATANGVEISTEKSTNMTDSTNNVSADSMNGQKLEEGTSFKYLRTTMCKDGTCSAEIRIKIA